MFIKRFICIVLVCIAVFLMQGCKRVKETDMDELTMRSWYAENPSGVCASLEFFEGDAVFTIFDDGVITAEISGAFAVDKDSLFISCDEFCKTFSFGYKVFGDRCEITYGGECLVFYPEKSASFDEFTRD